MASMPRLKADQTIQPWWEVPLKSETDPHNRKLARLVVETVQDIERRQPGITEGNRRHARIYLGYLPTALAWGVSAQGNQRLPFEATKGLVRGICDAATALIVRSRPKSTFVTDGGDFEAQKSAEDLDQFMVGAFERSKIYQIAPRAFMDSTIFGTGGWKYVEEGTGTDYHVMVERVLMDDIVVDEEECREHLQPENVYHRTMVRIEALVKKYAKGDSPEARALASAIRASSSGDVSWNNRNVPPGRTVLVEAIRVGHDGTKVRVLCVDNCVLEAKPWPYDFHPYTFLWWTIPMSGFYGDGIAYRQYGRQQRITYTYRWIQRCHDLFATPRAWVDPAGGPPTMQISNELGAIIQSRRPPTFQTQSQVVPPEVYSWLKNLEEGGFEDEGISQTSAQNQLPPGIDSAPAQREYNFKEGQRFAPVSQRWEHAIAIEAAEKMVAMYKRYASRGGGQPTVAWAKKNAMYTIKWPDLERDAYIIRPEASSLESLSPASRYQGAMELAQTGWITPDEGRALIGHPDLKESDDLDTAPRRHAMMVLKQLWAGEKPMVDEQSDLQTIEDIVKKGRLLAITKKAPPKIVDGMSQYIDQLEALKQQAAQAAQQQQMMQAMQAAPAMAPSGGPGAPTNVPMQGK